jgi:ABC-type transport system involved in multi-copper enzyme maturation permease subunit
MKDVQMGSSVGEALWDLVRNYAIFHLGFAAICCGWAVWRLRSATLAPYRKPVKPTLVGRPLLPRPAVGRFPLLWKEIFAETRYRSSTGSRVITYLLGAAIVVPALTLFADRMLSHAGFDEAAALVRAIVLVASILSLLAIAVRTSASISGERDRQTLDSLLSCPTSTSAILFSKWAGSLLSLRWAGFLPILVALGCAAAVDAIAFSAIPILIFAWFIYAGLIAMIGLYCSMVCATTQRATLWALMATIGVCVGHWALWLVYVPYLTISETPKVAFERLAQLHLGLTPPVMLTALAYRTGDFEFVERPTAFGEMPLWPGAMVMGVIGLAVWALATAILWRVNWQRLSALANRTPRLKPEPPPEGVSMVDVLRAAERRRKVRRRLVLAGLVLAGGSPIWKGRAPCCPPRRTLPSRCWSSASCCREPGRCSRPQARHPAGEGAAIPPSASNKCRPTRNSAIRILES